MMIRDDEFQTLFMSCHLSCDTQIVKVTSCGAD